MTLDAGCTLRDINLPDYEPGVFPASRSYDVDRDYRNFSVELDLLERSD